MSNPVGRPRKQGASFDPDQADGVDTPPILFKQLYVACPKCGSRLSDQHYAFFPSTVYITGHCERCDETRSAFFAPEPDTYTSTVAVPSERVDAELEAFIAFLTDGETASDQASPRAKNSTESFPGVFSGTDIELSGIEPLTESPSEIPH